MLFLGSSCRCSALRVVVRPSVLSFGSRAGRIIEAGQVTPHVVAVWVVLCCHGVGRLAESGVRWRGF